MMLHITVIVEQAGRDLVTKTFLAPVTANSVLRNMMEYNPGWRVELVSEDDVTLIGNYLLETDQVYRLKVRAHQGDMPVIMLLLCICASLSRLEGFPKVCPAQVHFLAAAGSHAYIVVCISRL
jgi:hypothetical protein